MPMTPTVLISNVGADAVANGQVALSTTAATVIAANTKRRRILVKNLDATIVVFIGRATVSATNGFRINAGETVELTGTGLIQGIAASGTPSVAYWEEADS